MRTNVVLRLVTITVILILVKYEYDNMFSHFYEQLHRIYLSPKGLRTLILL